MTEINETDRVKRKTRSVDVDGLDTTYGYDSNTGELLSVDYENANTPDITYTYDRVGRQATVADATGSRSFAYDATTLRLNAETLDTTFYGGTKLKHAYQDGTETNGLAGRSAGYELGTAADADAYQQVDYTFDASGRLKTVAAGTDTFSYNYGTNTNRLASLTAPQHTVAYTYETNRDRMTAIDNRISGSSYSNYAYSHDALGRRTSREQSGSAFALTNTDTFAYNTRSEVTGSTNSVLTSSAYTPTYTYDKIGNRESSTGISPVSAYTTNQLNQYTAIGATNPTYDADGNLTSNGTWTYSWNGENRLRTATKGRTTINFTYDYLGRLVKKDDGINTQVYLYDGWHCIATFNLQSSNLTLQTAYLWGLDLSGTLQGAGGVGGLLKEGANYPLYDANGNITQKLNGTGTAVMNVDYDPFGNIIRGNLTGEYGFSTKPLIDGIDWYYYGFRYYDPVTGRWLNRDPIGEIAHRLVERARLGNTFFAQMLLEKEEAVLVNSFHELVSSSTAYNSLEKWDFKKVQFLEKARRFEALHEAFERVQTASQMKLLLDLLGFSRSLIIESQTRLLNSSIGITYQDIRIAELNLYSFLMNDSVNLVDKDGRAPWIAIAIIVRLFIPPHTLDAPGTCP